LLCPSYRAIVCKTGLCKQSVANGLARLERCGILKIVRRLVRERIHRTSPFTGMPESYVGTVQTTSLYSIHRPAAYAEHLEQPRARRAPVPEKRQLELLDRMELLWSVKLGLESRREPISPTHELANRMSPWKRKIGGA